MEPVFKFQVMFEQSLGLREPWHVTKALFNEQERAVHVYISGRKTAEYPCPECGKLCRRYDDEEDEPDLASCGCCSVSVFYPQQTAENKRVQNMASGWSMRRGQRAPYARFTLGFEGYAMLLAQIMST